MNEATPTAHRLTAAPPTSGRLGDRLRLLRVSAGLTQTELAGDRFSKEYVSQIERGKTRPTQETVEWLAQPPQRRSGVPGERRLHRRARPRRDAADPGGSPHAGPSLQGRARGLRRRAERCRGDQRGRARGSRPLRRGVGPDAGRRPPRARIDARDRGSVRSPRAPPSRISIAQSSSSASAPVASRSPAPALRSPSSARRWRSLSARELPCDVLRADIFQWRSRCHRRQRDFEAAREDAERALELAQAVGDRSMTANSYFQASLVAERTGHWVLSRSYAEKAKSLYQELNDERDGRPGAEQPRRPEPAARQAPGGDRAPEVLVRRRRRGRVAGRRGRGDGRARDGAPPARRLGGGREARTARARAARRIARTSSTRSAARSSSSAAR